MTNPSLQADPVRNFEPYYEQRYTGMLGRFIATALQLLALVFGGGFAYVRSKKAEGEAWSLTIVMLRIFLVFTWPFLDKKVISQPFPIQFRIRLERLGPTYIKLGQILSLREDILPAEITEELKNLLERLPAIGYDRCSVGSIQTHSVRPRLPKPIALV
jgi:ubiquinone biosynthesis protein